MNPVLFPAMADPKLLAGRVPLHPEDAAQFRETETKALQTQGSAFRRQMDRLSQMAENKRAVERYMGAVDGPVDQERSLRIAANVADREGFRGDTPVGAQRENMAAWMASEPDSRNYLLHSLLVPENAIMGAMGAFTDRAQEQGNLIDRLGKAVPGAFYPPAGYAIEPERDEMYRSLGTIGGTAMDYLMPGPGEAVGGMKSVGARLRYGGGAPVHLIDQFGNEVRRLRNPAY
jgi:hypothetical protein